MSIACDDLPRQDQFVSTRWTIVRDAADSAPAVASEALAELCKTYWPAIYGYLRRRGYRQEDAQDLTQSFFQHIVENETIRRAAREKGRFRSFLMGALQLCVADDYARKRAAKRGGTYQFISVDELEAEELYHQRISSDATPDEVLDARWASVLVERALQSVRTEFEAKNKAGTFDAISPFLSGDKPDVSYQETAESLGISLGAAKTLIHRLRRQFAEAIRREIVQTVSAPHEVDDELQRLRAVFSRTATRRTA